MIRYLKVRKLKKLTREVEELQRRQNELLAQLEKESDAVHLMMCRRVVREVTG